MSREKESILELINKVKTLNDNDSFIELNALYKNLCYNIALSIYIYEDFELDKNAVMMDAIRSYDPERCVFGTYLANKIKYHCFKKRNELKTEPKIYASGLMIENDINIESNVNYADYDSCKQPEQDDKYGFIREKLATLDSNDKKIIELRYFSEEKKGWREIGKEMGMSGQAALNRCNKIFKELRKDIPELAF